MGLFLKISFFENCWGQSYYSHLNVEPNLTIAINKLQRSGLTFNFSAKVAHIGVPSTHQNIVSSETTRPFELKFHMKTPYDRLAKIYTKCTGHMTKMATKLIYGKKKTLLMSSSLEPKGQWPWDLVCIIGDVGSTRFAQMINLGWPWPTLWQGQIWFLMHLFGENLVFSTKSQADLWPFIQGHSFGLPHTYLNICFSEITGLIDGLFIRLFKSLDQNVCNPHVW